VIGAKRRLQIGAGKEYIDADSSLGQRACLAVPRSQWQEHDERHRKALREHCQWETNRLFEQIGLHVYFSAVFGPGSRFNTSASYAAAFTEQIKCSRPEGDRNVHRRAGHQKNLHLWFRLSLNVAHWGAREPRASL
jgi:hypothetical protein